MERGKNLPPKNTKSKPLGFSGDFIALGPKQSRAETVDAKKSASSTSGGPSKPIQTPLPSLGPSDKKREAAPTPLSSSSQIPAKKLKPGITNAGTFTALGRPLKIVDPPSPSSSGNRLEPWEDAAIEVDASDLLNVIGEAESNEDEERIEAILCGSVKQLKTFSLNQRNKVEPILALALVYLAKWRSHYFNTELIVEALLVLLKRDVTASIGPFKGRTTAAAASLACNLLLSGLEESAEWPESFLKVFVEDSVGERIWVDREECQGFVENILTAFNTKVPSRNILQQDSSTASGLGSSGAANSPSINSLGVLGLEDEASVDSDNSQGGLLRGTTQLDQQQVRVIPRFNHLKDMAEALVMEIVNQHLSRRQQPASDLTTRNFLKFMASTSGLPAVRAQAAQRLEMWLSNQKLVRPATDLLLSVCLNCSTEVQTDTDVLNALLRLRLKSKPLLQSYLTCFKELVEQQADQLPLIVRLLIFNELSPSRGPNNMAVLAVLVQPWPDRAATILADVFMELLLNRDDYLRALRALLREVVRALRHDLPLVTFCAALLHGCMQDRRKAAIREFEFKDRLLNSLADLTTLCIFLAISPSVRESASLVARGDLREMELFRQFHVQASAVQRESISWLHVAIPSIFEPNRADYIHCLRKVLFMETAEHYYNKDGWPPESDRAIMIRLASEIPVMEETLLQILLIGLSKDHPLTAPDTLELADQLLRRCAAVHNQGFLMLEANNQDIFDMVLRLTAYHYPENIALPPGYAPPNLAISTLYWKAWLMLLMLIAHNPGSLGSEAWNSFPTLRALMEMCITNDFTTSSGSTDQTELQMAAIEKQTILEFETHLAAASTKTVITENNSLLLSQLTSLDPRGPTRRPPPAVIEQLRTLNTTLRLGHLLCRSRQPDFLLEILHRQGAAQSKPWLAELVESNEGAWNVLPVQCLCEFLLHEAAEDLPANDVVDDSKQQLGKRKERRHKHQQLVQHLRLLLTDPDQLPEACREVLDYLMRRLSAQKALSRHQALTALSVVLAVKEDDISMSDGVCSSDGAGGESQFAWLVHHLPTIPHFQAVRPAVIAALRAAFLVETQPQAVAAYLRFLSTCALEEPIQDQADLSLDLAQVIVERSSLIAALLPSPSNKTQQATKTLECLLQLFWHYLLKAREPNKGAYTWSENQDQVLIQWQTGEAASLHILVVHAMIILLTYGAPQLEQHSTCFERLLEIWFPASGVQPQAYLVETTEEAFLYPDWLKLRMIRSPVDVLVETALKDLEPAQLILFIQSFGIPVSSMSKLLQTLDRMVHENPFAFVEVDMDKVYIQQLLQIQWARGARGGLHFADIMQLVDPESRPIVDSKAFNLSLRPPLDISSVSSNMNSTSTGSVITVDHASAVLRQLFDIKTVIRLSQLEKNKAYRMLSNALTFETRASSRPSTEACAVALDNLLVSASGSRNDFELLLAALERQPAFSCGLLRLLTSAATSSTGSLMRNGCLLPTVTNICQKIAPVSPDGHSSLKSIALQFVKTRGLLRSESTPADLNTLDLSSKRLERHLQQLAARALETNDTRSLVKSIVSNLSQNGSKEKSAGLLVDWMELLDPEIITAQPDLETRLLFGKTLHPPSCRPYGLAMLVHQASWATLRKCIHKLLSTRDGDTFEPKVVLDFLSALIKVPKLWQGRDKHVPKHQQPEELLNLSHQQLFRLAEYIMSEFAGQSCNENKKHAQHLLQERSQLLLSCCGGSSKVEVLLARDVANLACSAVKSERQIAAQQLLLQLYVRAPHIITRLPKTSFAEFDGSKTLLTAVPCAIDSMALTLISSVTSPQPGKDGARKMADYESALRKMAATHPLLLLRQFSCLAAALRGRSHLDVFVLRSRNYLNVFSCVLGIAQQLSANLFTPDHREALEDMLNSFWCLFGNQRAVKESIGPLLQKFLQFLLDFVATAPFAASHCLQQHVPLLHDLQVTHPEMTAIKDLLSALSRPRPTDNEEDRQPAIVPTRPSIRLGPILARLRQSDNYEEVVAVLQDLENVCGRVVCAPLEGAVADLRPLMSSSNQTVRNMTYMLILRYLKESPNASTDLLPDYLDCLDNRNAAVVTTALERLPDFLLLCQENGDVLIQKAFNLAVESGYNTLTNLSEAVMLLQHQMGT
ncbi:integrator complex subunit 1 [Daphnia magna]|uniref:integrator complex subunit 1 n=1 Tax=Daphnia magna TaxID=35525 RepID=UPI001E1BAD35|nr:integrator complex subunit 1 [Daphnia magna]